MLTKRGFNLIELVTIIAIVMVLIMLATVAIHGIDNKSCTNQHLVQWKALLQKARSSAIQNNSIAYVAIRANADGYPLLSAVRDRYRSEFNTGDRYALAIGKQTDPASGATTPVGSPCGFPDRPRLLLVDQNNHVPLTVYENAPPQTWFNDNVFAFMPNGSVRDSTNVQASGIFFFEYPITDVLTQYGAIYVGLNGDIQIFWSQTGSDWFQVE